MRALLLLLGLVSCSAPPRPRPAVPAPPVLDAVEPLQRRRMFSLRGNVAPEALVRLYVDFSCAGPVYLQTTGEALREGVTVELIAGVQNVFSADALSAEGGVSACSNAISMGYSPALRPGQPSVYLFPQPPSTAQVFSLRGGVDNWARARLHEGDCSTPVIAELDAAAFFSPGFEVRAPLNGSHTVAVDAVNEDQRSVCVAVTAINDSVPPVFSARLASPTPTSKTFGYVVLSGEQVRVTVWDGPNCAGTVLATCSNCYGNITPFEALSTEFSVLGTDQAGNTACVPGSRPWEYDASVPDDQPIVLLPGNPPLAEVPVGLSDVLLYDSIDCAGPLWATQAPATLAWSGPYLPGLSTSGFVTARGVHRDGGLDPCSNAVSLRP